MNRVTLHDASHRRRAHKLIDDAPIGHRVVVSEPKHSDDQRAKLNAMCGELAKQATHGGLKLTKDDWRHLIAATVFKLRIVPTIDGDGVVSLAPSTAQMSVAELSAMIEGAYFVGSRFGVVFQDQAEGVAA